MTSNPKAIFVSPAAAAYGSERSMLALLRARTFHAEVVCPGGGALERELQELGIPVHPLEFGKYSLRQNPFWHLGFSRRFQRILAESKPDVVVINLDGNTPLSTLTARRAGIPIVRFSRFEFQPPRRWLDRYCWRQAAAVVCPSELVRQQVLAWVPESFKCRVHCFYDPVSLCEVADGASNRIRTELGLGDAKLLGYVGRLHPDKGLETVLHALAAIREVLPGTQLVVIGHHDGSAASVDYQRRLKELATHLRLQSGVDWLGYRTDVAAIMAGCDVCVLPSKSESFGMVLAEAWAVGTPTVASDVGGPREITAASGGGFLAPVGDYRGFSEQVLKLLRDPCLARKLGRAGAAWVKANCEAKAYASRFRALLEQVQSGCP